MPQLHLPMFPTGVSHITSELAFEKKDGCITYFNGHMPVFTHGEKDVATFRMITSQFCVSGYAKQSEIIRAFGVTSISVKRSVKVYREKGARGFYAPRVTRGAASSRPCEKPPNDISPIKSCRRKHGSIA